MEGFAHYRTPGGFDDLLLRFDGDTLTGLWFDGSHEAKLLCPDPAEAEGDISEEVRLWLDIYFAGRQPDFTPAYRITGSTPFRDAVTAEMLKIPYGETVTYGSIAKTIASLRGIEKMSAQAVGGAVGRNPISILIPCHRVMGAGGRITGYGGGIANKIALLALERRGNL